MHLRCFFFSNFAFAIEALLVCKIFGPKIQSCKFFDKSQVWSHQNINQYNKCKCKCLDKHLFLLRAVFEYLNSILVLYAALTLRRSSHATSLESRQSRPRFVGSRSWVKNIIRGHRHRQSVRVFLVAGTSGNSVWVKPNQNKLVNMKAVGKSHKNS